MWTFSNEEDLNNWYNSDNYQELSNKYRRPATELVNLTVVKGMPAR